MLPLEGEALPLQGCLPIIDKVYAYTDAAQAHARMEGGDHIGKIVLRVE